MADLEIAVIGGSGLYNMPGLTDVEVVKRNTPFGEPSDTITTGVLHGERVAFLPRHGRNHTLTPSEVPYRANIFALKEMGVRYLLSVSACGSLRERFAPGHVVIPDQLFDFTRKRESSFFAEGVVAHVGVPCPFSAEFSTALAQAVQQAGGVVHEGGTFITVEGPRFSTKGESNIFRQWGMDIIGMTTSPEAFLAAEAEMAFACMAHVTDYDVWHEEEEPVTVEAVVRTLQANTRLAQEAISVLVRNKSSWAGEFAAHNTLRDAFITRPDAMSPKTVKKLAPLVSKYLASD